MENLVRSTANAPSHELAEELRHVWSLLIKKWPLIAISVAICLTSATFYVAQAERLYQATARVLILQQGAKPLNLANNDPSRLEGTEDILATHSVVIASPLVVRRAIETAGLDMFPSLAKSANPAETVIRRLRVTRPDRTAKILQIQYQAGSPSEAVLMVDMITQSYRKFLEDSYQTQNSEVITMITKARDVLTQELVGLEHDYLDFHLKNPVLVTDASGRSFLSRRLEEWDRAANEATVKAVRLQSQLRLGRKLAEEGMGLKAVTNAMSQLGGEPGSLANYADASSRSSASRYVDQLENERDLLAERYGPQYAKVAELQEQIERVQQRTRDARGGMDKVEIVDLLKSTEQGLTEIEAMRAEIKTRFEQDREQAKIVENDILTEANLRSNLERHRALFNTVVDQLKQAQFVSDYTSISSQNIEPANALSSPVSPKTGLTLAFSLVAGCMLGVGAVVVSNRLDPTIHSVDAMRRALNMTVLGHTPRLTTESMALLGELGLATKNMPNSAWAECYRTIRTNIDFLRRNRRLQVILVTSAHSGDGKSTVSSNLAVSMAMANRRVLLVDADLRKPGQQRIHNLASSRGLTNVLKGLLPVQRVVQKTSVANLDLMNAGPSVQDPAELLTSGQFAEFVEEARALYDIVIVDSSPLLAVSDASVIAAAIDGVVFVARPNALKYKDAERALEVLRTTEAPILGVLINAADTQPGGYGYGYGQYGYGYGRGAGDDAAKAKDFTGADEEGRPGSPEVPSNGTPNPSNVGGMLP